jgi:3',5'-cyclic AMP phosphodiesterase CpdA
MGQVVVSLTVPGVLTRKHRDHLTIAHVSDLHFGVPGERDRLPINGYLSEFADELAQQQVDVLCVTGDVADNPIKEWLGLAKDALLSADAAGRLNRRIETLEQTLCEAREQISRWCELATINPSQCVFVVPGNHDLRPQGISANYAVGGLRYADAALDAFESVFAAWCRPTDLRFRHAEGPEICVRFVCVNSNDPMPLLNFARGGLSSEGLKRYQRAMAAPRETAEANGEDFSVCLVHHHPLPIPDAEQAPVSAGSSALSGGLMSRFITAAASSLVGEEARTLEGDQTTAFINAGMFISAAMQHGTSLVLHGHQHRPFFKALEHPETDNNNRMLVVGAGSLGQTIDGKCRYNLIKLYSNGNIKVTHRVIDVTKGNRYEDERINLSMDDYRLRVYRYESRRRHFIGARLHVEQATARFQAAAASATRVFRLDSKGGAQVTILLDGLTPVFDELERISLHSVNADAAFDTDSCEIRIQRRSGFGPSAEIRGMPTCEPSPDGGQRSTVFVRFVPPLNKGEEVDVCVTYRLVRSFSFVETPKDPGPEFVYTRCSTIFPTHLQQVVAFPKNWRPPSEPWVRVNDEFGRDDREEMRFAATKLLYLEKENIVTLAIDRPLPGLYYGVLWQKDRPSPRRSSRRKSAASATNAPPGVLLRNIPVSEE